MNSNEVHALLTALDDLIEIKILIRKSVPKYNLDEIMQKEFQTKLNSLYTKLNPIFKKYLVEDNSIDHFNVLKESLTNQLTINYALISSNSSKKRLKNIGIDPRHLIVSGGPIFFEDYKIINPKLTDKALEDIKRKCERILNIIENEDWRNKNLFFIYEKENPTDNLILNRLEDLTKIIGKKVKIIEIRDWKDFDTQN